MSLKTRDVTVTNLDNPSTFFIGISAEELVTSDVWLVGVVLVKSDHRDNSFVVSEFNASNEKRARNSPSTASGPTKS